MPSNNPAKKNTQYIFYIALPSQASPSAFQVNPTIASGDFKVSIDGGAFANPATLPAVTPAGGKAVKVTLSAAEMNGDNIVFYGSDAAGAEWRDVFVNIQTVANNFDEIFAGVDDIPTAAENAEAVLDEPMAEPTGPFIWAAANLRYILPWLGALSRNKTITTTTTETLRNDADDDDIATSTTSDDGTEFIRGEWT
jgi:hypothetical protein